MKILKTIAAFSIFCASFGLTAHADSIPGDIIVTLGENLSVKQKNLLLEEMNVTEQSATIIYVSNEEEHDYLGSYMAASKIGTKAISSSKIIVGKEGYGLHVETKNISWVSEEMYKNALITAGVTDADIYITAPFEVSGTGALTGLLKAYESKVGIEISEEQKDVANEELVKTAELGDSVGDQQATDLVNLIKLKMGEEKPKTTEEIRSIIEDSAAQLKISLSEAEIQGLVDLFTKMKELDIDWHAIGEQLVSAKDKFEDFINDPETKSWIEKIGNFFKSIIEAIANFFSSDESEEEVSP